jgi:hypothetical protein
MKGKTMNVDEYLKNKQQQEELYQQAKENKKQVDEELYFIQRQRSKEEDAIRKKYETIEKEIMAKREQVTFKTAEKLKPLQNEVDLFKRQTILALIKDNLQQNPKLGVFSDISKAIEILDEKDLNFCKIKIFYKKNKKPVKQYDLVAEVHFKHPRISGFLGFRDKMATVESRVIDSYASMKELKSIYQKKSTIFIDSIQSKDASLHEETKGLNFDFNKDFDFRLFDVNWSGVTQKTVSKNKLTLEIYNYRIRKQDSSTPYDKTILKVKHKGDKTFTINHSSDETKELVENILRCFDDKFLWVDNPTIVFEKELSIKTENKKNKKNKVKKGNNFEL